MRPYLLVEKVLFGDSSPASEYVMNDPVQPRKPNNRFFDGRMRALPASVPVYLGSLEDPRILSARLRKMSARMRVCTQQTVLEW